MDPEAGFEGPLISDVKIRNRKGEMMKILTMIILLLAILPNNVYSESDIEKLMLEGGRYFSSQEFDQAIESYEKALSAVAEEGLMKTEALVMLSSCYTEKGITAYSIDQDDQYYRKAIEYAEMALEIIPENWAALANIGTVYMNMDNLEKADFYFTEAKKHIAANHPAHQQIVIQHQLVKWKLKAIGKQD